MERKTILLVEDDDVVRDMIRGALDRKYRVLEASTYSEATQQIKNPLDIALVDYNLPDNDGFDVLKRIREVKPKLPVIFMTAYSTDNLAIKAFRSGVTDFIKKPLSFAYLWGKLSEILEGEENRGYPESVESREVFIMDCIAVFIEDNYDQDLTRDILAEKAHMERHMFSRVFNKRFHKSIKSHINDVRVKKAAAFLIKNPDLSITDIARSAGYRSIQQFERVFKQAHGISPKVYRRDRTNSSSAM